MLSLNKDIKIKILCSLSDRDLGNVSLVCKGLYGVYKHKDLWIRKTFDRFSKVLGGEEKIRSYRKKSKLTWKAYYKSLVKRINIIYKHIRSKKGWDRKECYHNSLLEVNKRFKGNRKNEFNALFKVIYKNTFSVSYKKPATWIDDDFIELYTAFNKYLYDSEDYGRINLLDREFFLTLLGEIFARTTFLIDDFSLLLENFYLGEGLNVYLQHRNTEKGRKHTFRKFLYNHTEYIHHVAKFMKGDEIIDVFSEEYKNYDSYIKLDKTTIVKLLNKAIKKGSDPAKIAALIKERYKDIDDDHIWDLLYYVKKYIDKDISKFVWP